MLFGHKPQMGFDFKNLILQSKIIIAFEYLGRLELFRNYIKSNIII
jgi:hypothetical protein